MQDLNMLVCTEGKERTLEEYEGLLLLGGLSLVYDYVIHWGLAASLLVLFCVGFCIFGSQVLLVGTLPSDLARSGTAISTSAMAA